MLIHNACRGHIVIQLKETVKVGCLPAVRNGKMVIGKILLLQGDNEENVEFYCRDCKTNVRPENILAVCSRCSELHPIHRIVIPNDSGGFYCQTCAARFSEPVLPFISLNKIEIMQNRDR